MPPFRKITLILLALGLAGCTSTPGPAVAHPESAVVAVTIDDHAGQGFLAAGDGLIVASAATVGHDAHVTVVRPGQPPVAADLVQFDRDSGIVLLRLPAGAYPFLLLRGDDVAANQHARAVTSTATVSGRFDHWENSGHDLAFTAPLPADARGAPLIADDGTVIGVVRESKGGQTLVTPIWAVLRMLPRSAGTRRDPDSQ